MIVPWIFCLLFLVLIFVLVIFFLRRIRKAFKESREKLVKLRQISNQPMPMIMVGKKEESGTEEKDTAGKEQEKEQEETFGEESADDEPATDQKQQPKDENQVNNESKGAQEQ